MSEKRESVENKIPLSDHLHTQAVLYQYDKYNMSIDNLVLNVDVMQNTLNRSENNWIHVTGLNNVEFINSLCHHFGVHALVSEDILNIKQRIKVEKYDGYIFVVLRAIKRLSPQSNLQYEQISFILMPNLLISFSTREIALFDSINERLERPESKIRSLGVDYLLYAIMDTIVDEFMIITEGKGNILSKLESRMIDNPTKIPLSRLYRFRRELLYLRRLVQSFRDLVGILYKEQYQDSQADRYHTSQMVISPTLMNYLQDLYDHTVRTLETVDIFRDISKEMLDLHINSMNHKINERINILTIFSAIFIPLTFITGVFGMNFKVIPGVDSSVGFFITVGLMLIIGAALIIIFKLRKWF